MSEQRLIDANELAQSMLQISEKVPGAASRLAKSLARLMKDEMFAPTIDAVPVVRCKDCKHYRQHRPETWSNNPMRCDHPDFTFDLECYDAWLDVGPDDYCSKGELREEVAPDGTDRD